MLMCKGIFTITTQHVDSPQLIEAKYHLISSWVSSQDPQDTSEAKAGQGRKQVF